MSIYPLISRNSFYPLNDFAKEVYHLFNHVEPSASNDWLPAIDIQEFANQLVFTIDAPGMDLNDIDISIDDYTLTIKGKREIAKEEKNSANYLHAERQKGCFVRSFNLPNSVDTGKIDASYDNGVLTIKIPKQEKSILQKIMIKNGKSQ